MTLATLQPQFWWWIARATGLVAWCLVVAGITWGLILAGRLVRGRRIPAWLLDLHRYLGTLSVLFIGVHVLAIAEDGYVSFGPRELFIPFAATWRPNAVAWGIGALYLLLLVQVSSWSWVMRRLPRRVWHTIHLGSFLVLATGTVHGFLAGADHGEPAVQFAALAGATVVAVLALLRILNAREPAQTPAPRREAGSAATDDDANRAALDARLARLGSRVQHRPRPTHGHAAADPTPDSTDTPETPISWEVPSGTR